MGFSRIPDRKRFALITFAAVVAVAVTASMGRWQLDRAAQKQSLFDAIEHQQALQPWGEQQLQQVPDAASYAAANAATNVEQGPLKSMLHRPVQLQGQWLAGQTLYLDNRQMQGKVGFFVLTPLRLAPPNEAVVVAVQRGWVPRNFVDRNVLPPLETPAGLVTITGRLEAPPSRLFELGDNKPPAANAGANGAIHPAAKNGPEADGASPVGQPPLIQQNIDFPAWAASTGLPLLSLSVLQTGPASEGLQRDWHVPTSGVEKHYGYAVQWFGLSGLIVLLYVWFQIFRRFVRPRQPTQA